MRVWWIALALFCGSVQASKAPEAVMDQLLAALKNNDTPYENAGIEEVWRFAAPENKAVTGPLPRFIEMVSRHPYVELLNHKSAELGPPREVDERLTYPIRLITADGSVAGYVWTLQQQADKSWKTRAVMRVPLGNNLRGM